MDKKDNYDPSLDHKEDDGAKQKSNVDVGSSGPAASESKVDCTASSADECPFSSDPFAKNYRCVLDLNDPKLLAAAKEFGLMPAQLEILQSAEWAERRRPFEQINVRLKERGLLEKYQELIFSQTLSGEGKFERLKELFQREAPELMGSFMEVWEVFSGAKRLRPIVYGMVSKF
ncbi:hypothetical protein MMC16_003223 [Acarospora aff. strigata]|nr:hypothetical protein [Acarospora aff. strigata]